MAARQGSGTRRIALAVALPTALPFKPTLSRARVLPHMLQEQAASPTHGL